MKKSTTLLITLLISFSVMAENIQLRKEDYLTFLVSSYVHGFNEFHTDVAATEKEVIISIYYENNQDPKRAEKLADRFRFQVPILVHNYEWAKNISVRVSIYPE